MTKLKILHVTTSFPIAPNDNSGIFIYRLVKALTKHGIHCGVLVPDHFRDISPQNAVTIHASRYFIKRFQCLCNTQGGLPEALKNKKGTWLLLPFLFFAMIKDCCKLSKDYDLIHAHWSLSGFISCLSKRLHKRPVITTFRGSDFNKSKTNKVLKKMLDYCLEHSDAVTTVSQNMEEAIKTSNTKVHFIPNGIDSSFFEIDGSKRKDKNILKFLFVGTLTENKGLKTLLKALAQIADLDWEISIIGDGPLKRSLCELANSLGLMDKVHFLGQRPPYEIRDFMETAHCLILPSLSEGRANVILEAMAASLAVIATDIPANRELIQDQKNGWLFEPENEEQLAQALRKAIMQKEVLDEMGQKGKQLISSMGLSWDSCAEKYINLYKHLLNQS